MTLLRSRHATLVALVFAILTLALLATSAHAAPAASPASPAGPANPAAPVVLTPQQARAALQMLDDPTQRAHVEDTLRAIAAAGALATPAPAPAAANTPATTSGSAAAAAPTATALRSNGLVSQMSTQAARSVRMLGSRLLRARTALLDLPSARAWWGGKLGTPEGRGLLLDVARLLLITLVPALLVEWLIRRFVARPRRAIATHMAHRAYGATAHDVRAIHADLHAGAKHDADDSTPQFGTVAAANATTPSPATGDRETAESRARRERHRLLGARHWTLLQRLPAALLAALLALLPVIAFGLCAAGILSLTGVDDPASAASTAAVGDVVDTYVICRVVLVLSGLLFAPGAASLRLMPLSDRWAAFAERWAMWLVIVGGAGGVLRGAVELGMTEDAHLAFIKAIALVGHLMIAVAILQCRRPVSVAIRHAASSRPASAYLMHWLADVWAGVAVFAVIALWLVWAFDVRGGYEQLVRLGGLSLVVMLGARVVAIVALGAIGRVFDPLGSRENMTVGQRRAYRYYPWLRRLVTFAIWITTLDLLLHIWGIHLGRILMGAAMSRLLGSALMTIAVAVLVAVVIWEVVNVAAERRLENWTQEGDYVRAARLRTLLPMLRTSLLVAILIVVGLTALSQLGVNTGPLVAGASIFGVALGFGSQKLVQDFITGIFLLTENAMQVGDWVTVAGVSGTVEFLSIRTVRLRGGDGSLYTVPFSSVTTVNNTNRGIGNAAVKVVIAYGADVKRAVETLQSIGTDLRNDEAFSSGILSDFAYWGIDQVDGANVTLVGQIQCKDSARWSVQREFNRRVLERFTALGIELANPQRNFVIGVSGGAREKPADGHVSTAAAGAKDRAGAGAGRQGTGAKDTGVPTGSTSDARGTSPGSKPSL